jgi:hypothetical protein
MDDDSLIARHLDLGEDVRGQQDGVFLAQFADQGAGLADLAGVEAHRGLVEDQDRWIV